MIAERLSRLCGVVALVALLGSNAALAQTTHSFQVMRLTPHYSGERGGPAGFAYNLSCPDGRVLIGVHARAGWVVDRVQGICRPVTAQGAWTGSESVTATAGGGGGSATTRRCPANHAVSGFRGRQGGVLDRIELECTRLASNDAFDTSQRVILPAIGGGGGTAFGITRCSRPGRALSGRSGAYVDAMRVVCERASPLMTGAQVDAALSAGSSLLQTDADGRLSADIACPVTMRRSGIVRIQPSLGLWVIDDLWELNRVLSMGGPVIVNAINQCSGVGSFILGCARWSLTPQFVVVPFLWGELAERGTLWAHELGHTRGLPHRNNNSSNLMFERVSSGGFLNNIECSVFGG